MKTTHSLLYIDYLKITVYNSLYELRRSCFLKPRAKLEGIIQPKISILSSFTCPHAVPNLYDFLSSEERKKICLEEYAENVNVNVF